MANVVMKVVLSLLAVAAAAEDACSKYAGWGPDAVEGCKKCEVKFSHDVDKCMDCGKSCFAKVCKNETADECLQKPEFKICDVRCLLKDAAKHERKGCLFEPECHKLVDWAMVGKIKAGFFARLKMMKHEKINKMPVLIMLKKTHAILLKAGMPEDRIDGMLKQWMKYVYKVAKSGKGGKNDMKDCYFDRECHKLVDWRNVGEIKFGFFARLKMMKRKSPADEKTKVIFMMKKVHEMLVKSGIPEDRVDYILNKWVKAFYAKPSGKKQKRDGEKEEKEEREEEDENEEEDEEEDVQEDVEEDEEPGEEEREDEHEDEHEDEREEERVDEHDDEREEEHDNEHTDEREVEHEEELERDHDDGKDDEESHEDKDVVSSAVDKIMSILV